MLNWRDPLNPRAGGAERVTRAYLKALRERGHEVCWFANAYPNCPATSEIDGIQIARGGGMGTSVLKAREWYRQQPPFHLVIDQHHGIPWYAPWWAGTHVVAYIHEVLGPIWKAFYSPPLSTFGRWQERKTHRIYGRVPFWVPSESTRQALLGHGVRNVQVIPNGVDTVPITALPPKPLAQPLHLVAVSRLEPNKRVDHAIQVARLLRERGVAADLTIVGNGSSAENLRQTASATGIPDLVRFTGGLPEAEKNAELSRAHLLIHTSIREGWGLNVIEANAMGTPAVVYPVHGLVDSTVHRETGLVTEAESPDSACQSILNLLLQPALYNRMRIQAWERAKTFQWERVLPIACDWLEKQARGEI